ncbi:MAG: class I SAM-dependent DNA methyltransferase, partial [Magnetospirillum sp.]|nr:class I SAM-dependent DNA methyltransferase [Magnetospirillum sp.]
MVGHLGNADDEAIAAFIKRWERSEGGEHRTYVMFLTELCDMLGVDRPDVLGDTYGFERRVDLIQWDGSTKHGRIDLYKRGSFVLEAKQGSFKPGSDPSGTPLKKKSKGHGVRESKTWDDAMMRARAQAKRYIDNLPAEEGIPPFLIVVDIGYSFELFADFTKTGRHYTQFPDTRRFRFQIGDLADPIIRDRLRKVWTNPWELDPSRVSARVTRDIADKLARLAQSLESD